MEQMKQALLRLQRSLSARLAALGNDPHEREAGATIPRRCTVVDETTIGPRISAILQKVAVSYPGCSILAYGSQVYGKADRYSDLDIIAVDANRYAPRTHEGTKIDGVALDITRMGAKTMLKQLKARSRFNNNWFLDALRECYIYSDEGCEIKLLLAEANKLLRQGPPPVHQEKLERTRTNLYRVLRAAERYCARSISSPDAAVLARMQCDQVVAQSIYALYGVQRQWTASLRRLLARCESEYPDYYALWVRYTKSTNLEEAARNARLILEAVFQNVAAPLPDARESAA